jgi:Ca2+-transporting ATPase
MITGDQAATAVAIAQDLDLARGGPVRIVDSTNLA